MARNLDELRDVSWMEGVWTEQDTSPARIEAALRELLCAQHQKGEAYAPARVLNLVVIADREWRGEIQNRLSQVGRYHASRTILCAVEPGRTTIDAWATMTVAGDPRPGEIALCHEEIVVDIGPKMLPRLETVVDPLVVPDLATVVWSPHGHPEGVDALLNMAQVVLLDSVNEPDPATAVRRARELGERAYLVDLAWLRSTPWRERIAASFDPPAFREELGKLSSISVRHRPDSSIAGILFFGWLATRLGWEPGAMLPQNGSLFGRAARGAARWSSGSSPTRSRTLPAWRASRSRPPPACRCRSTADAAGCRPGAARARARSRPGRSWAPRGARRGSLARGSVRPCCATPPTVRR